MLNKQDEPTVYNVEVLDVEEPIIIPEEEFVVPVENYNIPNTPIIEGPIVEIPEEKEDITIPKFSDLLSDVEEPNDGEQLVPGKFFNLVEETEQKAGTPVVEENPIPAVAEEETFNLDFSSIFNPTIAETKVEEDVTMSPNFGIPNFDDIELPVETPVEDTIAEPIVNNTFVVGDMKAVVNTIRNCAETIEKYGFTVDTEEFDLEDMYQVIIKINKK